jgi:hypothetical protein
MSVKRAGEIGKWHDGFAALHPSFDREVTFKRWCHVAKDARQPARIFRLGIRNMVRSQTMEYLFTVSRNQYR